MLKKQWRRFNFIENETKKKKSRKIKGWTILKKKENSKERRVGKEWPPI
jgi:hypothetical protein